MRWMISNRNLVSGKLENDLSGTLTFWVSDAGPVTDMGSWRKVTPRQFQTLLAGAADEFPPLASDAANAEQKHVTLFVHGYNVDWNDAVGRYDQICRDMFSGDTSLGECVLFTWPSNGRVTDYLSDRHDAAASGAGLADVLAALYDWLLKKQADAFKDPANACKAKISVIAHSMGNFVLQKAAQAAWTRKNQPMLVSLINQCLMVAADVDNDLFGSGETQDASDGTALANLTYRITALYSGLDDVLGVSAGLKHFGKRRLGRSGLDPRRPVPDNVWDVDCSAEFESAKAKPTSIHSAYFDVASTRDMMRHLLRGTDRGVLERRGVVPPRG